MSDYFNLVMPRPFDKGILYPSFHEKVIYVVVTNVDLRVQTFPGKP